MTKEQKLKAIYEEIANKTLKLGCRIKSNNFSQESNYQKIISHINHNVVLYTDGSFDDIEHYENGCFEILGSDVMIGDILDWLIPITIQDNVIAGDIINKLILLFLDHKSESLRLPIDQQSDECIDFVYDLVLEKNKNEIQTMENPQ